VKLVESLGVGSNSKVVLLTCLALLAFAANSVLCRLALGGDHPTIDAASFTVVRLFFGAMVLSLLLVFKVSGRGFFCGAVSLQRVRKHFGGGGVVFLCSAPFLLFIYAAMFSYAYILLDAGVGALVLFGVVQVVMVAFTLMSGRKLKFIEWLGVLLAFFGFVYLMLPSLMSKGGISLPGFILMVIAGMAWAGYTLKGKVAEDPLVDSASNFLSSLPLLLLFIPVFFIYDVSLSLEGVLLAAGSGALASGLGYAIWYAALKGLSSIQAGVVQLFVPVVAAVGGVIFIGEEISLRLLVSAAIILGGILLVILVRK